MMEWLQLIGLFVLAMIVGNLIRRKMGGGG